MPEVAKKFSIWSIPKESWSSRAELEELKLTEEAVEQFKREFSQDAVEERVRPFRTPVTQETLSKLVR